MLFHYIKLYVLYLGEIDYYRTVPKIIQDDDDYDYYKRSEMRHLKRTFNSRLDENSDLLEQARYEFKLLSMELRDALEEASEEDLKTLQGQIDEDKERLEREYEDTRNPMLRVYLNHYDNFIPPVLEKAASKKRGSRN